MRKLYLLLFAFLLTQASRAQIAAWDFTGETSPATSAADVYNANLDASNQLTRGAGAPSSSASNSFRTTGFQNNGISTANTDYFQFTVSAAPGYTLNLSTIDARFNGTASFFVSPGVTSQFAYSLDGTTFTLIGSPVTTTALTLPQVDLTGIAALQNVPDGTTVTFRYYASGQTTTGGWGFSSSAAGVYGLALGGSLASTATNSISTGAVATAPFCVGSTTTATGTVAFTSTGTFNTTFNAFLSDASGSFASATNVGSTTVSGSAPSGTINITIPAGTASGTGYKIRVDAVSPATTGSASAAFSIVLGAANVTGVSATTASTSATINWTNPANCFDEVLIVVKAGSSISGMPTGDGSAYMADLNFGGSGTAFDGGKVVYKGTTSGQTVTGLTTGTTYFAKLFTRRGTDWSAGVEISFTPQNLPAAGEIVINQFSPDYGGASDEYVELLNKTNKTFNLSSLAIRYQSASGSNGTAGGVLSGTLAPNSYWLLSPNGTITVGNTNNLARDGAITSGFAGASGQLALVRVSDNVIIDALAYGTVTGGLYTENTPASTPPTDGGLKRTTDGADTDNNSADFSTVATADITLRNSSSVAQGPLPVKFSGVTAAQKANGIQVDWSNASEQDVVSYSVERSPSGRSFTAIAQLNPMHNNGGRADYSFLDAAPLSGDNFYRIKSVEANGKTAYSTVVRINPAAAGTGLVLYPNPVTGNELGLQITKLPAGQYSIAIFNAQGQQVSVRSLRHAGGAVSQTLTLSQLNAGSYSVQVSGPVKLQKQFLVQ